MEPPLLGRHSRRNGHVRSCLSFRSFPLVLSLGAMILGMSDVGICASPQSETPLLIEAPSDIPPAIAQAFPSPQMAKR